MSDNKKTVIALGFFDSVHLGHRAVVCSAKKIALNGGASLTVFSFAGNLRKAVFKNDEKIVYNDQERQALLRSLGADEVYFAPTDQEFLDTDKKDFLDFLNEKYDICAYVCGEDYRFGKGGKGDVEYLREYAKARDQKVFVENDFLYGGQKVSTSNIKKLLESGDLERANILLCEPYSYSSIVVKDRRVGSKIGFPTINFKVDKEKQPLKNGVYAGHTVIFGKKYKTVINYGNRPTFNLDEKLIEAHIIDFSGDLYGEKIKLYFDKYLREVKAFKSAEELKEQLEKDVAIAKGINL